jgi:hypothetical protein
MNTTIVSALVAAAIGFGAAWKVQDWRMTAKEMQRAELQLSMERELARNERLRQKNAMDAISRSRIREQTLRRDVDAARLSVAGLRQSTDAAVQSAGADLATCVERTAAIGQLLDQCAGEYQGLAEKADRHVFDIRTLIDIENGPKQ